MSPFAPLLPQSPVRPPKRGTKGFCSYFCPATCLSLDFLSKDSLPLLNQGEDFKAIALNKNSSLTTCRDFQEKKKSACGCCGSLLCPVWADEAHF